MNESYTLHVAGLARELKKVRIAPDLRIASFVMLGDTRLIEKCADALYEKIKGLGDINMLVCPEAKGIPLTHALAVRMGVDYVVARKSVKAPKREAGKTASPPSSPCGPSGWSLRESRRLN